MTDDIDKLLDAAEIAMFRAAGYTDEQIAEMRRKADEHFAELVETRPFARSRHVKKRARQVCHTQNFTRSPRRSIQTRRHAIDGESTANADTRRPLRRSQTRWPFLHELA
jgi:ElaB/YqjD/DUF883 family membrane-anchored ribosome-binding protein